MDYRVLFAKENEEVSERYELAIERIRMSLEEETANPLYSDFFHRTADFILLVTDVAEMIRQDEMKEKSIASLELINEKLYEDILPENYAESYADPAYACLIAGEEYGPLFSLLYTELRGMITYAYEQRYFHITICAELFLQVYGCFLEEEMPKPEAVKDILYWYFSDYLDVFIPARTKEMVDSDYDFINRIILESDLEDERYLYQYGEYISENERTLAAFLREMPQEKVKALADTFTEGIHKGFLRAKKDVSKKNIVNLHYPIGAEAICRYAIMNFKELGWETVISRPEVHASYRRASRYGAVAKDPNPQYTYDHRFDRALFYDKAYVERSMDLTKQNYEIYGDKLRGIAGVAVLESFGETPFIPKSKEEAYRLSEKQEKLQQSTSAAMFPIREKYMPSEETSFTIMSLPSPEIGEQFAEIFEATTAVNNLDEQAYQKIQQALIDALDEGDYVHVKGSGENRTDIRVKLAELSDPSTQTLFENCLADVNIPVGEVFTSPKLTGTEGTLHVSSIYLNGLLYKNLELTFKDGFVSDYRCDNFETEEKNRSYIRENVLANRDTLPLGEFAIGTNTTAYAMAKQFDILPILPILITEKMGPHFAVGDTCYSHEEDAVTYNPDGKAIVARENECSAKRNDCPQEAYFFTHTDITIPYEELDSIVVVKKSGETTDLIRGGRFVLAGTTDLNKPLEEA